MSPFPFAARFRVALVILACVIVQNAVLDIIQVGRAHADLLLLLPVLGGLLRGAEAGAVVGFFAGLAADLSAATTLGLTALCLVIVGFAVGLAHDSLLQGPWWIAILTGAAGSGAGVVLFAALAVLTAQDTVVRDPLSVATVLTVVAFANASLSVPMLVVLRWAMGDDRDREAPSGMATSR